MDHFVSHVKDLPVIKQEIWIDQGRFVITKGRFDVNTINGIYRQYWNQFNNQENGVQIFQRLQDSFELRHNQSNQAEGKAVWEADLMRVILYRIMDKSLYEGNKAEDYIQYNDWDKEWLCSLTVQALDPRLHQAVSRIYDVETHIRDMAWRLYCAVNELHTMIHDIEQADFMREHPEEVEEAVRRASEQSPSNRNSRLQDAPGGGLYDD